MFNNGIGSIFSGHLTPTLSLPNSSILARVPEKKKKKMDERRREVAGSQAQPASSFVPTKPVENLPPPPGATPISRRRLKRKSSNFNSSSSSSASSKRLAREKANTCLLPPIHNGPLTRARQLSDNAAYSSALNAVKNEALSAAAAHGDLTGANLGYEDVIAKEYEPLEAAIELEYEGIRNRDFNAHAVPVHCGWYSWTKIHPIEEQALPSFFCGKSESRTPEIYMGIRNWIMRKFHANPNSNVEVNDLSELSIGELDARQEVMEFLELWGLINYHPFLAKDISMTDANVGIDGNRDEKMDSLVEQLYRFENEHSARPSLPKANPAAPSGWFHESALAEELVKQEGPAVEYHCNSCSADCSRKMYHCQKQADFDLCSECYNNGKFGSDMSPLDFILMEPGEAGASGGKWTDQETLLLLEALELFKENWNEIAEHVATKTKAQCILHFLQMPIEDAFLDNDEVKDSLQETSKIPENLNLTIDDSTVKEAPHISECQTGTETQQVPMDTSNSEAIQCGKGDADIVDNVALTALKQAFDLVGLPHSHGDKLAFSEAGNPVMTLATFLAHLVEPGPATASARCALKSVSSRSGISPSMQLALRHCFILEDPPEDVKEHSVSDSVGIERPEQVASKEEKRDDRIQKDMNHNEEQATKQNDEGSADQNEEKPSDQDGKNAKQVEENPLKLDGQNCTAVLEGPHSITDHVDDKAEHATMEENKPVDSRVECESTDKSQAAKNPGYHNHEQVGLPKAVNEPESSNSLKEQPLKYVKKSDDSALSLNYPSRSVQDSKASDSAIQTTHCVESQKDVQIESANFREAAKDVDRETAQCADALMNVDKEPYQRAEALKNVDMEQNKKKQDQAVAGVGIGCSAKTGEDKIEDGKTGDPKSSDCTEDPRIDKLKRAAVTTIAAAAVKAKLLADQEEDEVRQLTASLIDKQMRKLEVKLSFFSEMEDAVMRLKELLERSRQKLYQERAQIIAARFGLPASSSRMMPSTLPANRMAMGLANTAPRPLINLAAQRPSVPRPSMASGPQRSNSCAPSGQ